MGPGSATGLPQVVQNSGFPLSTELSGTSITATAGCVTADCTMIFTSNRQIGAILPSTIPPGSGSLTVSYNGQTSAPLPIEVIAHDFGIFSVSQMGYGQGVITDPFTNVVNTIIASSNPGQLMDIWGTGLGAVSGDEAAGPLPGDMANLDMQMIVGGKPAQIIYRDRSGCCAGVDQIRFIVPEDVNDCYVPVRVIVDGIWSNDVTMSIADNGPYCSSPGGLTAGELQTAVETGTLRQGVISISRARQPDSPPPFTRSDYVEAFFHKDSLENLLRTGFFPSAPHVGVAPSLRSSVLLGLLSLLFSILDQLQ